MIKKKYVTPEMDIEKFQINVVLTTSTQDEYDQGDEF